jgi:SAM-dependent methyltransferase
VINLSPDKPQVFGEMVRVLKPGGRIAVSDMVANHPLAEEAGKNKEDWCGCTAGALTDKAYTQELSKAGFIDIRLEPDVEAVMKAVENGQARTKSGEKPSKEQVLESLCNWERSESTMVVPFQITASKPA